jgi:uncharacterized damage-inducible protein DinB
MFRPRRHHDAMRAKGFCDYWSRVRDRTDAVVARIPAERADWSPGRGAMTFADVVRHLALTERWLFVEVARGRASQYISHDAGWAASWPEVRALMASLHRESLELVSRFDAADWDRRVVTPAGTPIAAHKWLRAMCEHEAHHRGQLYLMLRLCGIGTPPIFGMTAEEVGRRARAALAQAR